MKIKEEVMPEVIPTLCYRCDLYFDLNDGHPSLKWYDHAHICPDCHKIEIKEINTDHRIKEIEGLVEAKELTKGEGKSMIVKLRKNYYYKLEAEL